VCATPLEARVRELRLITEHAPRYNKRSKHPERQTWVRLTDEPYPRLSVVPEVRGDVPHIGPFTSRRAANAAVEAMHDAIGLRQCTQRLPVVARTPRSPCALAGLGRCSAPCTMTTGPDAEYPAVVEEARTALTGDPGAVVEALAARVARLAAQERFEEAG